MNTDRGFTLLEVLVAMSIFATLAATVLSASQMILRQAGQLEERQFAVWVLDNHMQSLRLQPDLLKKVTSEVSLGGRRWRIEQHTRRSADGALCHVELSARTDGSVSTRHRLDGWLKVQP